jgi:hypothetical protein
MKILKTILMKREKVKVKFLALATSWGYAYYRGSEAELETTENLAGAVAAGRVELIGEAPANFKKRISEIQEYHKQQLKIKK